MTMSYHKIYTIRSRLKTDGINTMFYHMEIDIVFNTVYSKLYNKLYDGIYWKDRILRFGLLITTDYMVIIFEAMSMLDQ